MSRQSEKELRLRQAMEALLPDPRFHVFVDTIRELKEGAIAYAVQHTTVRDQRESLAALGEVRAYSDIISLADAHMNAVEHQLVEVPQEVMGV